MQQGQGWGTESASRRPDWVVVAFGVGVLVGVVIGAWMQASGAGLW